MIWMLFACVEPPPVEKATETCDACGGECLQQTEPAVSREHVEGEVAYASYPPSSGDHDKCWAEWGVHTEVVQPENFVHNLEHGGVVFVYADTVPATDIAALTTLVGTLPEGRALLTPASDPMDAQVAAVAWQRRILLGCYDETALTDFFWANVAHAPENVTSGPGSSCAMGGDTGDTADSGDTSMP